MKRQSPRASTQLSTKSSNSLQHQLLAPPLPVSSPAKKTKVIMSPPVRSRAPLASSSSMGSKVIAPPPPLPVPPALTHYRTFLNSLAGKAPANLTNAEVSNWEDVNLSTPQGKIINEIAKKFTAAPRLGINSVNYNPDINPSFYSMNGNDPQLDLSSRGNGDVTRTLGPEPMTLGHELVHANDHQIDQLNPKVWQNLGNLAKGVDPTGAPPVPMAQSKFFDSIQKIQRKIDPVQQIFSYKYPMNLPKLEQEVANATQHNYKAPMTGRSVNWQQLFRDIDTTTSLAAPAGGVPNQGFHLPFASEFPAYMTENLTRPWGVNQSVPATRNTHGVPALSLPEGRFLYNTLGDMGTAYPANDPTTGNPAYPTMNQHIGARRNSMADAYYPPQPGGVPGSGVPATGFSKGGRIKAKSKSKKSGLFSYFND